MGASDSRLIFAFLTTIQIPSLFCAIQVLRFGPNENSFRRTPNHLLFCLLIVSMWAIAIDLPFTQAYLWMNSVPIKTEWACYFYNMSFFCVTGLNRSLMAFMCVERHFVVFNPTFYRTSRSRFVFHYLPLSLVVLFVFIYFLITMVFVQCPEKSFHYSSFMCGYTCTVLTTNLGTLFTWFHVFFPIIITFIFSILLPIRFVVQKRTVQHLNWQRTRKMIIQTSTIATAYILCWLPFTIILQLYITGVIPQSNPYATNFFTYGPYATSLLTPFIVQHTIPGWVINMEVFKRIKHKIWCCHGEE